MSPSERFNAAILEALEAGERQNPLVAHDLVTRFQKKDEEALVAWLMDHATSLVNSTLGRLDAARRAHATRTAPAREFAQAASEFERTGNRSVFDAVLTVDEENTRRRIGDCRRADLTFVADRYGDTSKRAAFLEACYRALAKKVGTRTVAEVFTEEQLRAVFGEQAVAEDKAA